LVTKSFQDNLPALVAIFKSVGDATRVEELTQRNGIVHPGFLPPTELKISGE
jgi:prophage DNA circulation protein